MVKTGLDAREAPDSAPELGQRIDRRRQRMDHRIEAVWGGAAVSLVRYRRLEGARTAATVSDLVATVAVSTDPASGLLRIGDERPKTARPVAAGTVFAIPPGAEFVSECAVSPQPVTYLNIAFGKAAIDQAVGPQAADHIRPLRYHQDQALAAPFLQAARVMAAGDGDRLYHDTLAAFLLASLMRAFRADDPAPARGGLAPWQLKRAHDAMEAHLDGEIGLRALADIVGCSPTHFCRAFKQSTGMPPVAWMLNRRIVRAQELLSLGTMPLAEIALAVGFSAQPQFTTAFRRLTGMTPGAWRRARQS